MVGPKLMVGAPSAREEEQARLAGARGEFVTSLPRRLDVLRAALATLEADPNDRKRQNGMLRRVHALSSAARVLGFATASEVLSEAERAVRRATRPGNQGLAFQDVSRALDLLPSLVLGAPAVPRALGSDVEATSAERAYPLSLLLFASQAFAVGFGADDAERMDLEQTEDSERAKEIARTIGPDVAVVDADLHGARELVQELLSDPQIERMPLVVIGNFVSPDAATAFVALGAERVLPKPVSPETLRRTVFEMHELASRPQKARDPLGEVTVDVLVDRISQEIRKGLVESVEQGGHSTPVDFADGADVMAAVWGAVARVRELVTVKSQGAVRFQPFGPEGAIPLAPWTSDERRAGERSMRHGRGAEDVALRNRRILVADDDPAVVWFMTSLFKAVGAEVLEAHDGDRALEQVFESSPDLVVSDVLMPGRDGFALCHEIKRDVVARDIPVILLSWKEDLLQRVRELGADADGYLRKEAAASTVVERVREVLRPRARIEQRLSAGGESRGRLDGITPRFVLERVCRSTGDATLTVRDAVYLYELQVREGRVRSATRTASDGSFERGERVLAAFLGVSAGRFAVSPDSTPGRAEFYEPLEVLLAAPIARARAALSALSAERLPRVLRVGIDRGSIGRYLECTPGSARQLIEELLAGRSPRDLLLQGETSPWLLESVLSDLARRGAISGVEREDGDSRFASAAPPRPRSQLPSPAPPAVSTISAAHPSPPSAKPPPQEPRPPQTELDSDALNATALDSDWSSSPPPGMIKASSEGVSDSTVGTPIAPQLSMEALGASTKVQESRALESAPLTSPEPAAEAEAEQGWFRFQLEPSAAAGLPPVAPLTSTKAEPEPELSPESLSIFAALAEPAEDARPPAQSSAVVDAEEPIPDVVPASDDLDLSNVSRTLGGIGPVPAVVAQVREHTLRLNETAPLGQLEARSARRPILKVPEKEVPSPGMAEVIAAAVAGSDDRVRDETATRDVDSGGQQRDPSPDAPESAVKTPPTVDAPRGLSADDLLPITIAEGAQTLAAQAATREKSHPRGDDPALLDSTLLSEGLPAAVNEVSSSAPPKPRSEPRPEAESGGSGAFRTTALALIAFGAAFGLVRYAFVPMLQPKELEEAVAVPTAASVSVSPVVSAAAKSQWTSRIEDLALPAETPIEAGYGLVEISGEPGDTLYFDDMLVGREKRRVSAKPGQHQVRITRGTETTSLSVDVVAGRMTRVSVSQKSGSGPTP